MSATKPRRERGTQTERKARTEPPWNVILRNEELDAQVVWVLRKAVPGVSFKRATAIMYEAHSNGRALVKRCHKELAELYKERLQGGGLTVSLEPTS